MKLSLTPPPTFTMSVAIPVPAGTANVGLTFKYRDRPALGKFAELLKKMPDEKAIAAVCEGWDLDDPFNAKSIKRLCDAYPGAGYAIVQAYLRALLGIGK